MSAIWALVPVKALQHSKSRLGDVLAPEECAELSRAMLIDVLAALNAATVLDQIAILTNDDLVKKLAVQAGCRVIDDQYPGGLSAGLNAAASQIKQAGAKTLLIVPGDVPTINGADIDALLSKHSDGVSVCRAARDGGTNALVCSPPHALPFQFGANSAQRHLETAEANDLRTQSLSWRAFSQDIDTPDDLLWLIQQDFARNSIQFLKQLNIVARIDQKLTGASA